MDGCLGGRYYSGRIPLGCLGAEDAEPPSGGSSALTATSYQPGGFVMVPCASVRIAGNRLDASAPARIGL
jgi:hypothetical protein